ncbi:hypothetical protein GEMRC1_014071 [Eukaryota sp. GEM-RC1]
MSELNEALSPIPDLELFSDDDTFNYIYSPHKFSINPPLNSPRIIGPVASSPPIEIPTLPIIPQDPHTTSFFAPSRTLRTSRPRTNPLSHLNGHVFLQPPSSFSEKPSFASLPKPSLFHSQLLVNLLLERSPELNLPISLFLHLAILSTLPASPLEPMAALRLV